MKLHPLRVGNVIVDFEDIPYYFRVEEVDKDCILYRKASSISYVIDDHRVELSEPILLALGFMKYHDTTINKDTSPIHKRLFVQHLGVKRNFFKITINYVVINDDFAVGIQIEDEHIHVQNFRYLDQLQNIIFDLFGVDIVEDETKLPI